MLALLALVMRLMLPSGFMVAGSAGQGTSLVICTGTGAQTVQLDPTGHPGVAASDQDYGPKKSPNPSDSGRSHPCAFAASGHGLAWPDALPPTQPVTYAQAMSAHALTPSQRPGLGLAAPPPYTTGPPTTV